MSNTSGRWGRCAGRAAAVVVAALVFLEAGAWAQQCQAPQVVLETGTLRGSYQTTHSGRRVAAFQGVPYAKPPVGKHRFKESVPIGPWLGTLNATSPPDYCLQWSHIQYEITGSEDCLYLNVYTPRIPTGSSADPLMDVIVHIHGGAFMFFSGAPYGPKYLLDKDVVLVTINYRLGPLGFFSTGDDLISGNLGMKDQVMALKWIRGNIAAFGGNPNSVTITGMSAGGASVHYHMLSPLSKGLFHKAISMSGVSLNPWAFAENITEKSRDLASALGCAFMDSHLMVKCLRSRPGKDIVAYSKNMQSWRYYPFSPWAPTVEPPNPNAFLPESPVDIIQSGKANDVPWLTSYTNLEGLYPASDFVYDKQLMDTAAANWETILPDLLEMSYSVPKDRIAEINNKVTDFYLNGKSVNDPASIKPIIKMLGDRLFDYGIAETAVMHAKKYQSPIYVYKFSYEGENSLAHSICHCKENLNGASHGDDLGYVLECITPKINSKEDLALSSKMVNLWITFAKMGIAEWSGVNWPTLQETSPEFTYLEIGPDGATQIVTEKDPGNMKFWHSIDFNENILSPVNVKDEL